MRLERQLVNQGHVHTFLVSEDREGWVLREEEDATVLKQVRHDDWHRVERDALLFELRIDDLKRQGWQERSSGS